MKKLVISLVLINLLAACASKKAPEPGTGATTPSTTNGAPAKPGTAPAAQTGVDPLNDPASILAKRSVYYPFDVSVVQDEDKPVVQAHGAYLKDHPNRTVKLEGNCDERGSNEYNIGLGQRRADGVKKMLELSGANPNQISSVSYGEEQPKAAGHDEASWKQNRRTDLNYAK